MRDQIKAFLSTYPGQWMDMDQLVRETGLDPPAILR